jgi:hypothetical protein
MPNLAIQKMHAFLKNNSICNIQTLFEVCYSLRSNMFNFFLRILPRMPRPWRRCLALRAKRPQAVVTSSTHKKKWMCTIAKNKHAREEKMQMHKRGTTQAIWRSARTCWMFWQDFDEAPPRPEKLPSRPSIIVAETHRVLSHSFPPEQVFPTHPLNVLPFVIRTCDFLRLLPSNMQVW